jgi:hypothetical protein
MMADPQITAVEAEFTLLQRHFTGIKRRVAQRYRCPLATLGRLSLPDGTQEEAWAHNLSETGIGLNMSHSLDAGTRLTVRLRGSVPGRALALQALVIHSTQELDGSWRVGCVFTAKLSQEDLDALLL